MRIIRLAFTATDKIKLHELTNYIEVDKALAYLTQWALDAEDKSACTIMIHGDEMTAVYRPNFDENSSPTYVIGAVWHQDHFGFHS